MCATLLLPPEAYGSLVIVHCLLIHSYVSRLASSFFGLHLPLYLVQLFLLLSDPLLQLLLVRSYFLFWKHELISFFRPQLILSLVLLWGHFLENYFVFAGFGGVNVFVVLIELDSILMLY